MKILFFDDDKKRAKSFISKVPSAIWINNVKDCISEIILGTWDFVFLDHDISSLYEDSSSKLCGMEVVRFIEKNQVNVKNFIIHSLNYSAAQIMADKLYKLNYKVEYYPFPMLIENKKLLNSINGSFNS